MATPSSAPAPAAVASAPLPPPPAAGTTTTTAPTAPEPTPIASTFLEPPREGNHDTPAARAVVQAKTEDEAKNRESKAAPTPPTAVPAGDGPVDPRSDDTNPLDFEGSVDSNNDLPTAETLARIENCIVLDRDGKSHPFKSLYAGKHTARRVLIIFVRHFFCGNCQEYLRTLSQSITPESLLRLPISTFIAVVGCGDPALISMYAEETKCPFPVYADPTRKLYDELGMMRTLSLGARPAYMNQGIIMSSLASVFQGVKQIRKGLATKAGDMRQIGGEFLFEPLDVHSPVTTPWAEVERTMGDFSAANEQGGAKHRMSETSLDGKDGGDGDDGERKRVTWCHRMKTTRDHAEIPELMEVLGLDGQGMPVKDKKRWSKALEQRKGTGLSMASQMSAMKAEAGEGQGVA
ncbi:AhpC/TSA antioxidant enzyme-domain-containing protein [Podospora didyma]|uniref:AhpC/TSA antioxidant enzyme-domain-containing protein n=1 Tax=Podospora didyma TaxID=330526 RepID=A0AAE0NCS3_9PEZI|nr:AhpC/TSA antioxidant enzyme-domain-containing protein [Podospora didyma]